MTENACPYFEATVLGFEVSLDSKPSLIGVFRVAVEPIGLTINGIRVSKSKEGKIFINLPAEKRGGEWRESVKLGPSLHGAVRAALVRELKARGLMPEQPERPEPAIYNPDEPEPEIPLPATLLNQ